jgi:hypothetical protein
MAYYITTKIEVVGGDIVRTPIAFEDTEENMTMYDTWCDWSTWVENNKIVDGELITLPEHTSNPSCHEGGYISNSIEGLDLTLIEL